MSHAITTDKKIPKQPSILGMFAYTTFLSDQAKNDENFYDPRFTGYDGQSFINDGNERQAEALTSLQTYLSENTGLRGDWNKQSFTINSDSPLQLEGNFNSFVDHLMEREGYENTVYLDSLGKATVGVGHLVLDSDNLKVGDTISDEQVRALLDKDASKAWNAAVEQVAELGVSDPRMVEALAAVNYQLGTDWNKDFKNTWAAMKSGDYETAANNIGDSLWAQQTPARTADFIGAINSITA